MLPAHQRLDAENLPRLQVDLRLVDDAQLVARDGVPEIAHQREPLGAVAIELRRVDDAAGSIFLRDVHRHVGALHQHFGLGAVLGRDRDADAAVHVEVEPFDGERLLHGGNQLARGQLGARLPDARQHHGELVAAEARDGIATRAGLSAGGGRSRAARHRPSGAPSCR